MKIERKTKVQKHDKNTVRTTVPSTIAEIMDIKQGTKLKWTLENEKEVKITKDE